MQDLKHNIQAVEALAAATIGSNTTTVGAIVDTAAFDGLTFAISSGTVTDGAFEVLIEDGDDSGLSDAAAVPDNQLLGTEAEAGFVAGDDNEVHTIGLNNGKRYVRLSIISTGVSTGGAFSALAIRSHAMHAPPVQATNG